MLVARFEFNELQRRDEDNMKNIGISMVLLSACAMEHEVQQPIVEVERTECGDAYVAQCAFDDRSGVTAGEPSISTCGVCRRIEEAYYARASELGCGCEPFPMETCPLGTYDGCFVWQADQHAQFIRDSISCDILVQRAGRLENYAGFECGGPSCLAPPYFSHRESTNVCAERVLSEGEHP